MSTESTLNQSMESAVKHYSSLFWLPSYKNIASFLVMIYFGAALVSSATFSPSIEGLAKGLLLGATLFITNLLFDGATSALILRRDPIYNLRRTLGLSLYCWVLWLFFIFTGVVATFATSFNVTWWLRLCLFGFSAVLIFRLIVLSATSSANFWKFLAVSILQPFVSVLSFLTFLASFSHVLIFFLGFSIIIAVSSSFLFVLLLNRVGKQMFNIPGFSLLRAFLLNWVADLNAPFEELMEKLGENQDVEVSLVKFNSSKPIAVIVVSSVHPGPFKNVGSSSFPSMLKSALETKLGCVACTPLGLLGHEFDLASQIQNQKIINHVTESADFEVLETTATPFVTVSSDFATACCQIFGNIVFLSFTLSPKTTEDLPHELGLFVRQEAKKYGLECAIGVNAHNSIDGTIDMEEALNVLKHVASACLKKAVSLKQSSFEVGAATVIPKEFGIREGMGEGGITVIAIRTERQTSAYVVVDGNNMVSGLRDKILSSLHFIGIDECEVFTTDTHTVNAVILGDRGYHPVGEAMNHESLIQYIKKATSIALSDLKSVQASCRTIKVSDVKVIGEKRLKTLCLLIDKTLHKAKRIFVPIFATSGLLLMLFLMFV